MNRKGFTLVELLAVLVVIGLIAGIAVPSVVSSIKASKKRAAIVQEKTIIDAAKNYVADLPYQLTGDYYHVEIYRLIDTGYLKDDNEDSTLESEYGDKCVNMEYSEEYNQWEYKIDECPRMS